MTHRHRLPRHHADSCTWTATTTHSIDTVQLTVKGVCREPTPGYTLTLTRVEEAGADPTTLLLLLTVTPPSGIEPDHVTHTPVEYTQTFVIPGQPVPTHVEILSAEATIDVQPA